MATFYGKVYFEVFLTGIRTLRRVGEYPLLGLLGLTRAFLCPSFPLGRLFLVWGVNLSDSSLLVKAFRAGFYGFAGPRLIPGVLFFLPLFCLLLCSPRAGAIHPSAFWGALTGGVV